MAPSITRSARRLLACAVLFTAAADAAGALRCGNTFVRTGDTKYEVLKHCGEPVFRDRVSGEDDDQIEQWVYESEWSRFPRMVTFIGGRVARIERLDD